MDTASVLVAGAAVCLTAAALYLRRAVAEEGRERESTPHGVDTAQADSTPPAAEKLILKGWWPAALVDVAGHCSGIVVMARWLVGPSAQEMQQRGLAWIPYAALWCQASSTLLGMLCMQVFFSVRFWHELCHLGGWFFTNLLLELFLYNAMCRVLGWKTSWEEMPVQPPGKLPADTPFLESTVLTLLLPPLNLHIAYMSSDEEALDLMDGSQRSILLLAKALKAVAQTAPMCMLMALALGTDIPERGMDMVAASSLGLSVLSAAYGLTAHCLSGSSELRTLRGGMETFALMLLDTAWLLSAHALCMTATALEGRRFDLPLALLGLQAAAAFRAGSPRATPEGPTLLDLLGRAVCCLFSGFVDFGFVIPPKRCFSAQQVLLRRAALLSLTVAALVSHDLTASRVGVSGCVAILGALVGLHSFLSLRFYHRTGCTSFDVTRPLRHILARGGSTRNAHEKFSCAGDAAVQ